MTSIEKRLNKLIPNMDQPDFSQIENKLYSLTALCEWKLDIDEFEVYLERAENLLSENHPGKSEITRLESRINDRMDLSIDWLADLMKHYTDW